MPASITFRLKSSNHVGTVDVPGKVISCREAQEAIAQKLSAPPEEIQVFLAGSTALLHPEEDIPAYAAVEVVRHVATGRVAPRPRLTAPQPTGAGATMRLGTVMDSARPLTEEERLAQLQAEVTLDTGIDEVGGRLRRGRGGAGFGGPPRFSVEENFRPPPKGYICHNCGKGGHLIQHCPAAKNGRSLKVLSLPVGIPESMLVECTMDDPSPKFITRDYRLVKRRQDTLAFTGVPIMPPSAEISGAETIDAAEEGSSAATSHDAARYRCLKDHVLALDAMRTPCCKKLLCKGCFSTMVEEALARDDLAEDDVPVRCPGCSEPLLMDDVVPAIEEREVISKLRTSRKREHD